MLRKLGPHDGSAEAEGGRTGAAVAAPRRRCESARFSSSHSASRPEGEGTRAAAARTGTSLACFPPSARPSAPPVPSPATASLREGPLHAGALGLPTSESANPQALPLCLRAPPLATGSRPLGAFAPPTPARRHLEKVDCRLTAKASGGRRPADAMTERSRRVKTPPPG